MRGTVWWGAPGPVSVATFKCDERQIRDHATLEAFAKRVWVRIHQIPEPTPTRFETSWPRTACAFDPGRVSPDE